MQLALQQRWQSCSFAACTLQGSETASSSSLSTCVVHRCGRQQTGVPSCCASTPAAACAARARRWPRPWPWSACAPPRPRSAAAMSSPLPAPRRSVKLNESSDLSVKSRVPSDATLQQPCQPAHDLPGTVRWQHVQPSTVYLICLFCWLPGARTGAGDRHGQPQQPAELPGEGAPHLPPSAPHLKSQQLTAIAAGTSCLIISRAAPSISRL